MDLKYKKNKSNIGKFGEVRKADAKGKHKIDFNKGAKVTGKKIENRE
jgi:hypothetical protein